MPIDPKSVQWDDEPTSRSTPASPAEEDIVWDDPGRPKPTDVVWDDEAATPQVETNRGPWYLTYRSPLVPAAKGLAKVEKRLLGSARKSLAEGFARARAGMLGPRSAAAQGYDLVEPERNELERKKKIEEINREIALAVQSLPEEAFYPYQVDEPRPLKIVARPGAMPAPGVPMRAMILERQRPVERWTTGAEELARGIAERHEGEPGLEAPLLDPPLAAEMAAAMAIPGGQGYAAGRIAGRVGGKQAIKTLGRMIGFAVPAAVMEYPVMHTAELLADSGNPGLAMLAALGVGFASNLTVEQLAAKGLIKGTAKLLGMYPEEASKIFTREVIEEINRRNAAELNRLARGGKVEMPERPPAGLRREASAWSPEISERMQAKMERRPARMVDSDEIGVPLVEAKDVARADELSQIRDFVTQAIKPTDNKRKIFSLGMVSSENAGAVKGAIPDIDILGYERILDNYSLRHILKKHGDPVREAARGQIAVTPEDFSLIPEIVKQPDRIILGGDTPQGLKTIKYEKRLNGVTYYWEEVRIGRRQVAPKTMFKVGGAPRATPELPGGVAHSSETFPPSEMILPHTGVVKPKPGSESGFVVPAVAKSIAGAGIGGSYAGLERDAQGNWHIDTKKALMGALAGAAAPALAGKAMMLGSRIMRTWDERAAMPFIEMAKRRVNGLIWREEWRRVLGMGRSQEFQDMMRNYRREVNRIWSEAKELGEELQALAPSRVEQRRLMQVIKGGITANPEVQARANKVQEQFHRLRQLLEENELLDYSRFDHLTRTERARLTESIRGPNPYAMTDVNALKAEARRQGLDPEEILRKQWRKYTDVERQHGVKVQSDPAVTILRDAIGRQRSFNRSRLRDYYEFGSSREYAPMLYERHEGLSPAGRKILEEEIEELKKKSRLGNPEGRQDLEATISDMEKLLRSGGQGREAFRAQRQRLNLNYAHRRLDMPYEVQRMLGLIEEAAYPVSKGMAGQRVDLRKAKLFQDIADHPEWAMGSAGRRPEDIPANFIEVHSPKSAKPGEKPFGVLTGMYVRKDIWDDLKEVEEWRSAAGKLYDKAMSLWKSGKVIWNPATHARNFYSNALLAYLGDVNPWDTHTYGEAFKAVREGAKNRWYKEAEDWGLFDDTFFSTEISKLRDDLDAVRDPRALKTWFRKFTSLPGNAYQGQEKFFKLAVFIKARDLGATVDEAARKAEKFIFNYSDIPPWVKWTKRWLSPFFTFTYKALPLTITMLIRKPHKVAAIAAAMYGLEEMSRRRLGMTKEEAAEERRLMPEWQRRRLPPWFKPLPYTQVRLPWRDKWGNDLFLDLSYILPFGNVAEKWGQSGLLLSDLLPSNPLWNLGAEIFTNRDAFTGRDIYNPDMDTKADMARKYGMHAWRELAPSIVPGGYGWNKVKTGIQNLLRDEKITDWAGRPQELAAAIFSTLLGLKATPFDEEAGWKMEKGARSRIQRSYRNEQFNLKKQLQRKEITKEEYQERIRERTDRYKEVMGERPTP